jgi:hypothetical protein
MSGTAELISYALEVLEAHEQTIPGILRRLTIASSMLVNACIGFMRNFWVHHELHSESDLDYEIDLHGEHTARRTEFLEAVAEANDMRDWINENNQNGSGALPLWPLPGWQEYL